MKIFKSSQTDINNTCQTTSTTVDQSLQVSLAVTIGGELKQTVNLPYKGTEVAWNSGQIWGQHT